MNDNKKFQKECEKEILQQGKKNLKLQALAKKWIIDTTKTYLHIISNGWADQ